MEPNQVFQKKISNLEVKSSCCEKKIKLIEFEEQSANRKLACKWKYIGCDFPEIKNLVSLHEMECNFFLEEQKKQKEQYFESIPLLFQKITQIIDK